LITIKLSLFLSLCFCLIQANEVDSETYYKVFGKKLESKIISIPVYFRESNIGEINARMENEKIIEIEKSSILKITRSILKEKVKNEISRIPKQFLLESDLPFYLKYIPSDLKIEIIVDQSILKPIYTQLLDNELPYFSDAAIRPGPFSGAINMKIEQSVGIHSKNDNYTNVNLNSFANFKSYVLSSQWDYSGLNKRGWLRGDTNLVKDDERNLVRYSVGDIANESFGYLGSIPMLGFKFNRELSIDPYKSVKSNSQNEFLIEGRSLVKYFVNNSLIKSEYLSTGKYSIKNLPLVNGTNRILIEVINEQGEKKILTFNEAYSSELVGEHELRFDADFGYKTLDSLNERKYEHREPIKVGVLKYGITNYFTTNFYTQSKSNFQLYGLENLFTTFMGNLSLGVSHSVHDVTSGSAFYLAHSFIFNSYNLNLKFEKKGRHFSNSLDFLENHFQDAIYLNTTFTLSDKLQLSLGSQYLVANVDNLKNKYEMDFNISGRINQWSNVSFFGSSRRDEFSRWNNSVFVFLTLNFPDKNTYLSSYYQSEAATNRISLNKDDGNMPGDFKGSVSVENNKFGNNSSLDIARVFKFADVRLAGEYFKVNHNRSGRMRGSIDSALLFAKNEHFDFKLSRPTSNSFALIKSTGELNHFELKNDIVNDLIPYQYRRIQMETNQYPIGLRPDVESFIIFPTYKSGHLLNLKPMGEIAIRGRILDLNGQPLILVTGEIENEKREKRQFFTNREGYFLIESFNLNEGVMILGNDESKKIKIKIEKNIKGIVDVGTITLQVMNE
jgi:outer membrane usher protein